MIRHYATHAKLWAGVHLGLLVVFLLSIPRQLDLGQGFQLFWFLVVSLGGSFNLWSVFRSIDGCADDVERLVERERDANLANVRWLELRLAGLKSDHEAEIALYRAELDRYKKTHFPELLPSMEESIREDHPRVVRPQDGTG